MRNKLCRLLTSPDTSVSTMGAELLFVLCKEKGKNIFVNFLRAHGVSEYSLDLKRALSSFQVMRMYPVFRCLEPRGLPAVLVGVIILRTILITKIVNKKLMVLSEQ